VWAVFAFMAPNLAWASTGSSGGNAGETLLIMSSARSEGMLAAVAGGGGLNGLARNPASLAGQDYRAVSGSYSSLLAGASMGQLEAGFPAGPLVLAVLLGNFNAGEIDMVADGGGMKKVQTQNDIVVGGSVAMPIIAGISAGLTMKWYRSTLVETYSATTQLFDAGIKYDILEGDLSFGGAIRNIGGSLKYYSSAMSIPVEYAVGSCWIPWHNNNDRVEVLVEAAKMPNNAAKYLVGTEVVFRGVLILRGGVGVRSGLADASIGAGLRFRSYGFDFARVSQPGLPASSRVSAEVRF